MKSKKNSRKQHATKIVYINGKRCFIDEDIAPLIKKLNKLGIFTGSSCQASCEGYCGKEKHNKACKNYVFCHLGARPRHHIFFGLHREMIV